MNERDQQIIQFWNDGIAARDIARHMGITKNVIIGVVNRNRDYVTRPMVFCNREKGIMSSIVRWGFKRRRAKQIPGTSATEAEAARAAIREKYAAVQVSIDAALTAEEIMEIAK